MVDPISSDGQDASSPDRLISFLVVDPSGLIDDKLTNSLLSHQLNIQIIKDVQHAIEKMRDFPLDRKSVVIYIEEIDQLISTIESSEIDGTVTYIILIGEKAQEGNSIAEVFAAKRSP